VFVCVCVRVAFFVAKGGSTLNPVLRGCRVEIRCPIFSFPGQLLPGCASRLCFIDSTFLCIAMIDNIPLNIRVVVAVFSRYLASFVPLFSVSTNGRECFVSLTILCFFVQMDSPQ